MGLFSFLITRNQSSPPEAVNIFSREFKANPYPFYAWLRAEAPAFLVKVPIWEKNLAYHPLR